MLIRIALIIAIIGGLAAGVLNFVQVKEKIVTTIAERDQFHKTADTETAAHRKFEKLAKDTQSALDKTNQILVATTEERDKALTENADLSKRNAGLTDSLKKTTTERDTAQNELAAWRALGIPLGNIKATLASLKTVTEERNALKEERMILVATVKKQDAQIKFLTGAEEEVIMPTGLKGKVLIADPRYDFVVLNIGEKQGVAPNGRLIINRNGKLVAKVQVKSVQADRSIANVMPGWKLGEIMEGDQALY